MEEIRTLEKDWLSRLARAYKDQKSVLFIDDANIGVDLSSQTILDMAKKAKLSPSEWLALGVSLSLGAAGLYIIAMGVADPEPTSKLGLLIGGGITSVLTGGVSAIWVLTDKKPPKITVGNEGVAIEWK